MERPEGHLKIALVGCGAMGSALLKGWISFPDFEAFWVITPHEDKVVPFLEDPRVRWFSSPDQLPTTPDVIVFAVKPFLLEDILPLYQSFKTLIISVAAGKTLSFYETYFPASPLLRAMPNLPVAFHAGVIGLLGNDLALSQQATVDMCFQKLGFSLWVKSDEDIDKLTALSGSGPAYAFYFMEALAEAAEVLGFDKKTANSLTLQTFIGADLTALASQLPPTTLRQQITSPKGTTTEALRVFEDGQLKQLMKNAVMAAFERAKALRE